MIHRYTISAAEALGWTVCNEGEAKVALSLTHIGFSASDIPQQFNLGPYRLDFALVMERVAIEADGWVHTADSNLRRDKARDKRLDEWGWQVIRVDTQGEVDAVVLGARIQDAKLEAAARAAGWWKATTSEDWAQRRSEARP